MSSRTINVTLFGLGLMGASLALALRGKGYRVSAYARKSDDLQFAKDNNIIDESYNDITLAAENADIIILTTPISAYDNIISTILPHVKDDVIISDVGSIKQYPAQVIIDKIMMVEDISRREKLLHNFIPAHPIAGNEKSGLRAGSTKLYQDKNIIITPTPHSSNNAIDKISQLWRQTGANITLADIIEHDNAYGYSSHIVQLLCSIFGNSYDLGDINNQYYCEFIRLTRSNPRMWTDILIYNKQNIITILDEFTSQLDNINSDSIMQAQKKRNYLLDIDFLPPILERGDLSDNIITEIIPMHIAAALINTIPEKYKKYAQGAGLASITKILDIADIYKADNYNNIVIQQKIEDYKLNINHFKLLLTNDSDEAIIEFIRNGKKETES